MKTPQTMTRFSASDLGMTPSATLSATALATAAWAGPNICTAWLAPLIETLVIRTVAGLQRRLGSRTASRLLCPWLWLARALANAVPTGPSFEPMSRSIWATSFPPPARASPMNIDIAASPWVVVLSRTESAKLAGLYYDDGHQGKEKSGGAGRLGKRKR